MNTFAKTVFLVTTYSGTQTVFADRETAEASIKQTRDHLVGEGLIGNLTCTVDELHVHERVFEVQR